MRAGALAALLLLAAEGGRDRLVPPRGLRGRRLRARLVGRRRPDPQRAGRDHRLRRRGRRRPRRQRHGGEPTRLCTAAQKNGDPVLDPGALLLCYKARPAKQQPKHEKRLGLHVAHQFGPGQLDTVREDELCVPTSMPRPE